ncbi:TrkH family potassium uptake protein [Ruminococcaceae bacterium OttesenSCG-928-L11]|nr:TrkH family potassium uptake protein [Ruminococcaceae bacterium OttesenSCG-928-L11]
MNHKILARYLGIVMQMEALLVLPSLLVACVYRETQMIQAFLLSAGIMAAAGLFCRYVWGKNAGRKVRIRESYVLIALGWLVIALMGALPFWFSRQIPSAIDCVFESISGFTTTAATVMTDVATIPRSLLFWRSFCLWIGGMGVLILLTATEAVSWGGGSGVTLNAENPGPVPGKLVPKLKDNARILYGIYAGLTVLELIFLLIGRMPFFDAVMTAMATAGTGGFTVNATSISAYNSPYIEAVVATFMLLCGINFNMHFFLLIRNFSGIRKNEELKVYGIMLAVAGALVTGNLLGEGVYPSLSQALRHGVFQVISISTTTGFQTANFGSWPNFSRMILFVLMFVGACAGSSGGGLKVARLILLFKDAKRSVLKAVRPRSVSIVKLDGKAVSEELRGATSIYMVLYFLIYCGSFLVVSLDNLDFEGTASVVAACLNNVGAGFGIMGQAGGYSLLSPLSKGMLSLDMLMGRLEIYPLLMLFSRRTWQKI